MEIDGIKGGGAMGEQSFFKAQAALRNLSLVRTRKNGDVTDSARSAGVAENKGTEGEHQIDFSRSSVRRDKVIEARKRIAEGYYHRTEIQEAITRSLLENFGMGE